MNHKSTKKEIIILRHNGGQLCNQLLLYTSVYAYCLKMGFKCKNYSFYEYGKYFNFEISNLFVYIFKKINNIKFYKSRVIIYLIYKYISYLIIFFKKGIIIKEDPQQFFYLPPTPTTNIYHKNVLEQIANGANFVFYLDGWTFRNPVGLKKYRIQIINAFRPKKEIIKRANDFIKGLKENFLVGIHIRQGEYKSKKFMGGDWYFNEKEVADILRAYLDKVNKHSKNILFILCSDSPLNLLFFSGLRIKLGPGSMMEDLVTLSMCQLIIGSNSTFGSFAAYYGNIPFFIFDHKNGWARAKGENLFQY